MHLTISSDNNYEASSVGEFVAEDFRFLSKISCIDYSAFPSFFAGESNKYFSGVRNREVLFMDFKLENVSKEFRAFIINHQIDRSVLVEEVKNFANKIKQVADEFNFIFFQEFYSAQVFFQLKPAALSKTSSIGYICMIANQTLIEEFENFPNVFMVPNCLDDYSDHPRRHKIRLITKNVYFPKETRRMLSQIDVMLSHLVLPKKKVIVCDLDNTLWGGVVGEDGLEGIRLGGHDHIGECFVDIQNALKILKNSGLLLTIASKNNAEDALRVFEHHSDMVLEKNDFVDMAINWNDKSENLKEISNRLSLGLDSFFFIDDNPLERLKVSDAHENVTVFDFPENIFAVLNNLSEQAQIFPLQITEEDLSRTESYHTQNIRNLTVEKHMKVAKDGSALATLIGLKVSYESFDGANFTRMHQLLNRTNQFSLAGRKYSENDLKELLGCEGVDGFAVRAEDQFGKYGLICVVIYQMVKDGLLEVLELSMSCRILGRNIEDKVMEKLIEISSENSKNLVFKFSDTGRNTPMKDFLKQHECKHLDC